MTESTAVRHPHCKAIRHRLYRVERRGEGGRKTLHYRVYINAYYEDDGPHAFDAALRQSAMVQRAERCDSLIMADVDLSAGLCNGCNGRELARGDPMSAETWDDHTEGSRPDDCALCAEVYR